MYRHWIMWWVPYKINREKASQITMIPAASLTAVSDQHFTSVYFTVLLSTKVCVLELLKVLSVS